jgi:diguanylate cyclase (GGDEF)-like protein/PAS domain S-box-containing protein
MSLAAVAGAAAGFLAAAIAVLSLWRGSLRHAASERRPYLWFAVAAGLGFASMIVGQTVSLPADETAMVVSYADVPALLFLPAMAAGLAGLASSAQAATAETQSARRSRRGRGIVSAYLLDGYVLAAALFLIGWVTLFGHVYTTSGADASTFAAELIHPLAGLLVLGACLPLVQAAGRRAVTPYLALLAMTVADSLAVGARAANTTPGVGALTAQFAALVLLALTPWVSGVWPAAIRWIGGAREVTTAAAATTAAVAGLLVLGQATAAGHLPAPVEFFVLAGMAALLAIRVVSLVRRVDSWSRVWQESGRQFRQLAERTSDVVLLCDLDGVIKYASRAVTGYGYTPESLRGVILADLLHPEDRAGGMRAVRRAIMGKAQRVGRYPCRVRAADGTWRHVQSTVSLYVDPGQPDRLLLTARDMSAQVALRRQVTHLTFHDGLTGLPNRAYVEQRAQDVLGQVRHAPAAGGDGGHQIVPGVIVLGMDGFTAVNDECGHAAGDLLLAQVARRLRLAVSPQDTVARWGGDEFAVLTESAASAAELADIAERLSRSVAAQPFRIGETDLAITASVGVARADGSPAAHVWRNAEMALARAKLSGPGGVEVDEPGRTGPDGEDAGAVAGSQRAGAPEPGEPADAVAGGPEAGGPASPAAGGREAREPGDAVAGGPEAGGPADAVAGAPEAREPAGPVAGAPEAGEMGGPGGGAGQAGVGPAVETIETAETPAGAGA